MFRIRFHGRGGQGMKTASRILGTCFFKEGFDVQDAPRYGAERRGAPIFAYVRASSQPIYERGVIHNPDLIVVADETLVAMPSAGVLTGASDNTVLLIYSYHTSADWQSRITFPGKIIVLPIDQTAGYGEVYLAGMACMGAAACLSGKIKKETIREAVKDELRTLSPMIIKKDIDSAMEGYDRVKDFKGVLIESVSGSLPLSEESTWVDVPFETADKSSPAIHAVKNSSQNQTGLWRTQKPVIDYARCKHCWWICSTLCPDNAIEVSEEGRPVIQYDHCKGCMICVAQCPSHANQGVRESQSGGGGQ